jgi:hypothetical protein
MWAERDGNLWLRNEDSGGLSGDAERLAVLFSHGENVEQLGKGRRWIVGVPRLAFAHHVNHLDAEEDDLGTDIDLKPSIDRRRA